MVVNEPVHKKSSICKTSYRNVADTRTEKVASIPNPANSCNAPALIAMKTWMLNKETNWKALFPSPEMLVVVDFGISFLVTVEVLLMWKQEEVEYYIKKR